jgi:hypothetical protein
VSKPTAITVSKIISANVTTSVKPLFSTHVARMPRIGFVFMAIGFNGNGAGGTLRVGVGYGWVVWSRDLGCQPKHRTAKRAAGTVVEGGAGWSSRQSVVTGGSKVMILRV